jgi:hypothetical protein
MKMRFTFFILTIFGISVNLSAQLITKANGKYGLLRKSGEVILEPIYDEVKPLEENWLVYSYRKGDKIGLYNFSDSIVYPCVYDEIKFDDLGYVIREGKFYGYVTSEYLHNKFSYKVVEPAFTYVDFSERNICLRKDSLYGLVTRNVNAEQLVPFQMEFPIINDEYLGFHYYKSNGQLVLLRLDKETKSWNKIEMQNKEPQTHKPFIVDVDRASAGDITIYDYETGKRISYFPHNDFSLEQHFSSSEMCVETYKRVGELTHVTMYDPYTGNAFYSTDLKKGEEIRCEVGGDRNLSEASQVCIIGSYALGIKYTYIGSLTGFTYSPYEVPQVQKMRLVFLGGAGYTGNWNGTFSCGH